MSGIDWNSYQSPPRMSKAQELKAKLERAMSDDDDTDTSHWLGQPILPASSIQSISVTQSQPTLTRTFQSSTAKIVEQNSSNEQIIANLAVVSQNQHRHIAADPIFARLSISNSVSNSENEASDRPGRENDKTQASSPGNQHGPSDSRGHNHHIIGMIDANDEPRAQAVNSPPGYLRSCLKSQTLPTEARSQNTLEDDSGQWNGHFLGSICYEKSRKEQSQGFRSPHLTFEHEPSIQAQKLLWDRGRSDQNGAVNKSPQKLHDLRNRSCNDEVTTFGGDLGRRKDVLKPLSVPNNFDGSNNACSQMPMGRDAVYPGQKSVDSMQSDGVSSSAPPLDDEGLLVFHQLGAENASFINNPSFLEDQEFQQFLGTASAGPAAIRDRARREMGHAVSEHISGPALRAQGMVQRFKSGGMSQNHRLTNSRNTRMDNPPIEIGTQPRQKLNHRGLEDWIMDTGMQSQKWNSRERENGVRDTGSQDQHRPDNDGMEKPLQSPAGYAHGFKASADGPVALRASSSSTCVPRYNGYKQAVLDSMAGRRTAPVVNLPTLR